MGARRALGRWGWRLVGREWREQLLILGLISVSIAVATLLATAVFHANQPESTYTGDATHQLSLWGDDLDQQVAQVVEAFPNSDVTLSNLAARDGTAISFPILAPPPVSNLGAAPHRLVSGRWPSGPGELAFSEGLTAMMRVSVGDDLTVGGEQVSIVGLVEDPTYLDAIIAVANPDHMRDAESASVLIQASGEDLNRFLSTNRTEGGYASYSGVNNLSLGEGAQRVATLAVLVMAAVVMLEIALLCSAGFFVLGQRRVRQFGLLSAIGATPGHLRLALRLNGIALGLAGGALGVGLGFLASLAAKPAFERLLQRRIEAWSAPWVILVPLVILAGLTGLLAAWWPARGMAKIPIVAALAARPPVARSTSRWAIGGGLLLVLGAATLSYSVGAGHAYLAAGSLLVALVGILSLTPAVTSFAGRLAPRLPLAPRIALRDLARHPNRTAAALASLVVALGIPASIILTSSSADANLDNTGPNLPDNWAIMMPGDAFAGHALRDFDPHTELLGEIRQILPGAELTEIKLPVLVNDSIIVRVDERFLNTANVVTDVGIENDQIMSRIDTAWVATPDLLIALSLDPSLASSGAALVSDRQGPVHLGRWTVEVDDATGEISGQIEPEVADLSSYKSIPNYMVPESGLERQGLGASPAGWLIENPAPITPEETEDLLTAIGQAQASTSNQLTELVLETVQPDQNDDRLRWITLAIGAMVAIAIISSMISLLRIDSASDDRTLAAVGAPPGVRRQIVASSTAFLALGGSLLAIPSGYLALLAIMADRRAGYPLVFPATHMAVLLLGVPAVATLGAYLLVRREPANLSRPA